MLSLTLFKETAAVLSISMRTFRRLFTRRANNSDKPDSGETGTADLTMK
jgi:hypothetical protein